MKIKSTPLNPWAFVAIVCSIGMCPFFTIAGVLLGIRALVDIKARPGTRGVRLAWAAICIGALVTGFWGDGMLWWDVTVRRQMQQGPIEAIIEGQSDEIKFIVEFTSMYSEEAKVFLDELNNRYGSLESGNQVESSQVEGEELAFYLMPLQADLRYELKFSKAPKIEATARFVLFSKESSLRQFRNKFAWICIHDEELGDLVYPSGVMIPNIEENQEQ